MKKHLTLVLTLLTLISTSAHAQLPSYLPADGLVGWWPFNGNADDESGNGNDGVVNGAVLTSDRLGNSASAYSFSNNTITVAHNTLFGIQQSSELTVSFWTSVTGGQTVQHFIGKRPNAAGSFNWQFAFNYPANIGLAFGGTSNSTLYGVVTDYQLPINDWIQITGTYQNQQWSLYINGDFIESVSSSLLFPDANVPLTFGNSGNFQPLYGSLDDIAIYNRALTEAEIQNLYTGTNTGNTVDTGNGAAPLPQGIPYQAAARDGNGQPVADSPVNVRFSLHEGALGGAVSYSETHALTTNGIGLFNTVFGNGTPEQSAFDSINWAATTKFLQVEVDLGNGYVDMGTTQLLSVPYAFRSAQAANIKNAALPVYPDNAAALAGGLVAGELYRTSTGDLKVVY